MKDYPSLFKQNKGEGNAGNIDTAYDFQTKWGWYLTLYNLCGNDLILQEKWLQTDVVTFLNRIQFLHEYEIWRKTQ